MPWEDCTKMSKRKEFILFVEKEDVNFTKLCERYRISPKTGYKWLHRWQELGEEGLKDRSRRPHNSPNKTPDDTEDAVVDARGDHKQWGGRKLRAYLINQKNLVHVPVASTINTILRRKGELDDKKKEAPHGPWHRFEHDAPNDLWQMDFKGKVDTVAESCYPLTVLDDHSRLSPLTKVCLNQKGETVREGLIQAFRTYGLPSMILTDNGSPWSAAPASRYTMLSVWLIRLGITVKHGRPYHPQTQGKDERFHRTMKVELLNNKVFKDHTHCQMELDKWREMYNMVRPHEALGGLPPITRYKPSMRSYPEELPPIEYSQIDIVRKVQDDGTISFKGTQYKIGRAFHHYPVAVRPTETDGLYRVYFCHQKVSEINLRVDII